MANDRTNKMIVIGLYTDQDDLNAWLAENLLDVKFQNFTDDDTELFNLDGIFCFDLQLEGRAPKLLDIAMQALESDIKVLWAVDEDDLDWKTKANREMKVKGATIIENLETIAPPSILAEIIKMYEQIRDQDKKIDARQTNAINKDPQSSANSSEVQHDTDRTLSDQDDLSHKESITRSIQAKVGGIADGLSTMFRSRSNADEEEDITALPDILDNVIAIGGFTGAGSSFIAWNIAWALEKPVVLVEGRITGTLAKWLGRNSDDLVDRDAFLEGGQGTLYSKFIDLALVASGRINGADIQTLIQIPKTIVVDVGSDWNQEIFKRAGRRVFVASVDPQHLESPRPKQPCINVLNQYPREISVTVKEIEKRFDMEFNMVVPADPRKVAISMWTRRPWVLMQEISEMEKWKRTFDLESE